MKGSFKTFLEHSGEELGRLPHKLQMAFGASCSERAFPNYVAFSRLARWGDAEVFRTALNSVWELAEYERSTTDFRKLEEKCESLTPDLDDFSSADIDVQAAAAQEAAFMIRLVLELVLVGNPLINVRIATFARDTIDVYVQALENLDPCDPDLEQKIESHPLMIAELAAQSEDLAALKRIRTREDLVRFKKTRMNPRKSNIGLEIRPA